MGLGRYYLAEPGMARSESNTVPRLRSPCWLPDRTVIYLAVWRTVALAQGGEVGGYDANDFTAYTSSGAWSES